ncbi:sugar-binding protein [Candidatus Poribacteria bacterium]
MRRLYLSFISFVFFTFFLSTLVHSYSGAEVDCLMANPPPNIDGIVGEKEWGAGIYLDKSVTLPGEKNYNGFGNCYQSDFIDDEKDCSGTLHFLWDKDALYLAAKITDDDLYFDGVSTWENDCTEWRWDTDGAPDGQYIGMWITPELDGEPTWMMSNADAGLASVTEELPSMKVTMRGDGYEWELKIPAGSEVLEGLDLEVGNVVGFTVSIGENDNNGADYSMPAWSLNPDNWEWNEDFWGEMNFSAETIAVGPSGKLAGTWGSIKTVR